MSKGKIICIANNKGGCGKTIISTHLAAALSLRKHKVLLIDNDPQGDSSIALLPRGVVVEHSLYELLNPTIQEKPTLQSCIYPSIHSNLKVLPNISETAALDIELAQTFPQSNLYLRNAVRDQVCEKFDFIIIDCPPTLSTFVNNALCCSDYLILPTVCGSANSLKGVNALLKLTLSIPEKIRPQFFKIALNQVDMRKTVHKNICIDLTERYGAENIFKTHIPTNTAFEQSEYLEANTVFKSARTSKGAGAFRRLAKEVIDFFKDQA